MGAQTFGSVGGAPKVSHRRAQRPRRAARAFAVNVRNESVLIVNCKSGGHAFLGLHLADKLLARGHKVTLFNDGDRSIESKAPFSQYESMYEQWTRFDVAYGSPKDPSTYPDGEFNVVYDNNGKTLEDCKPLIDTYAKKVSNYVFVGSAGAYKANSIEPMHVEGDERKAKAGHVAVENYLKDVRAPYTVFHPLYMYGPHTAKDCEQYFIDRIVRNRPVCIPQPGVQLTSISNVEDVASMMAAVPGKTVCIGQHYNASGDRTVTLDGIVKILGQELNMDVQILHYDDKSVDIPKGKGFPFRSVHFFASTDKAKRDLGWKPKHTFKGDAKELVERYMESGRQNKDMKFEVDDMIIKTFLSQFQPAKMKDDCRIEEECLVET